jgi:hypothetical protein
MTRSFKNNKKKNILPFPSESLSPSFRRMRRGRKGKKGTRDPLSGGRKKNKKKKKKNRWIKRKE